MKVFACVSLKSTKQANVTVQLYDLIRGNLGSNIDMIIRGFTQSVQANAGLVS